MNNTRMIATDRQRSHIPLRYQVTFEEVTNAELRSMNEDQKLRAETRAYAGWELDYREASGIEVYYDDKADEIKRRKA